VDLLISNPENTVAFYEQDCQPLDNLNVSIFFVAYIDFYFLI